MPVCNAMSEKFTHFGVHNSYASLEGFEPDSMLTG